MRGRAIDALLTEAVESHGVLPTDAVLALREAGFATAAVRRAGSVVELPEREQRSTAHILEASIT